MAEVNNLDHVETLIAQGARPILPFEQELLDAALRGLDAEQSDLGAQLGEIMAQSSETYHDNAPAEVIAHDSSLLAERASKLVTIMRKIQVIEYPKTSDVISLGNTVAATFPGNKKKQLLITGYCHKKADLPAQHTGNGLIPVTLSTPVGSALLGATPGQHVTYRVDGKDFTIGVDSIDTYSVEPSV